MKWFDQQQNRIDRWSERNRAIRGVNRFGFRHPRADKLGFVVTGLFIGLVFGFGWSSVILGVYMGIASGVFAWVMADRNHERRMKNGTSSKYDDWPPKS